MDDPRIAALETALTWLAQRHFAGCADPNAEAALFRAHMQAASDAVMRAGLAGSNPMALRGIEVAAALSSLAKEIAGG